jgi:lysosomal-associated membrane protein 1/2
MKYLILSAAFAVFVALVAAHSTEPTAPDTQTSTVPSTTTPAHSDLTFTTEPPSLSSTTPNDTQTTSSQSTVTTEATPVTTTSAAVTTAAPPDKPDRGNWTVHYNKSYCIRTDMRVRLQINYTTTDNQNKNVTVDVPGTAVANGSCGSPQVINLYWTPHEAEKEWKLSFQFAKTEKDVHVEKISVDYVISPALFPNSSKEGEVSEEKNGTFFSVDPKASYLCNTQQIIQIGDNVTLNLFDLHIQGYMNKTINTDASLPSFDTASQCPADLETNNIVPIAVGAALAALVVIVLIAYLISRNRSKRGYESV